MQQLVDIQILIDLYALVWQKRYFFLNLVLFFIDVPNLKHHIRPNWKPINGESLFKSNILYSS